MVTDKNIAALSYAARLNDLGDRGVGGLVLPEAGYSSGVAELVLSCSFDRFVRIAVSRKAGIRMRPGLISRIVSQNHYRFTCICRGAAKAILGGSARVIVA